MKPVQTSKNRPKAEAVFFYDATCPLCTGWAQWVEKKAQGRLRCEPAQGKEAQGCGVDLRLEDSARLHPTNAQGHAVHLAADGTRPVQSRSDAVLGAMQYFGLGWKLLAIALRLVPRFVRDALYLAIAKRRRTLR